MPARTRVSPGKRTLLAIPRDAVSPLRSRFVSSFFRNHDILPSAEECHFGWVHATPGYTGPESVDTSTNTLYLLRTHTGYTSGYRPLRATSDIFRTVMCLALMAGHPQRFSPSARPADPSCQATFGHGATTPQHPPPSSCRAVAPYLREEINIIG